MGVRCFGKNRVKDRLGLKRSVSLRKWLGEWKASRLLVTARQRYLYLFFTAYMPFKGTLLAFKCLPSVVPSRGEGCCLVLFTDYWYVRIMAKHTKQAARMGGWLPLPPSPPLELLG